MAHAEVCPICQGTGSVENIVSDNTTMPDGIGGRPCHGCGGAGWVSVQDHCPMPPPVPYTPRPWPPGTNP